MKKHDVKSWLMNNWQDQAKYEGSKKEGNALHPIIHMGIFDLSADIICIWDVIRFHQMRVVHFAI